MGQDSLEQLVAKADAAEKTCDEVRLAVYQTLVENDPELAVYLQRMGQPQQCEDWLFHTAIRFGGKRPIDVYRTDRADLVDYLKRMLGDRVL